MIPGLCHIFSVYCGSYCGMGIDHIAAFLIQTADFCCCLCLTCEVTIEVSQLCLHFFGDLVFAVAGQRTHQLTVFICIIACDTVDQTL